MATLSDASGQFVATCFDDAASKDLEDAAREGKCGLLTVELDRRPGEETPRVTVKRLQPFDTLATVTRMAMTVRVADAAAMSAVCAELITARGARGEVRVIAPLSDGEAVLLLGRDFALEGELAARLEALHGVGDVELRTADARLTLVG